MKGWYRRKRKKSGAEYDPERKEYLNQKRKYLLLMAGMAVIVGITVSTIVLILNRNGYVLDVNADTAAETPISDLNEKSLLRLDL